jgi:uncharacterized protein
MAQAAAKQQQEPGPQWSHGNFCWNELMTRNVERAKAFYRHTIGWTYEPMKMADGRTYTCALQSGTYVAGIFPIDAPEFDGVPEGWMSYLAVDDVDGRVEKALKAGAKLMKPISMSPASVALRSLWSPAAPALAG